MTDKDLGYRKVQSTGRGSFIISLPKEWVNDVGLQRGSEVAFSLQFDSSLTLTPRKILEKKDEKEKSRRKEYYISLDPEGDIQSTLRMIQALYVISADIIHMHFKEGKKASKSKNTLKNFVRDSLLGAEIIDETLNELTLQVLIKHSEFPIEKAVRRMAIIALSSNKDAILALKNPSKDVYQEVLNGHNDVNRLGLYVVRQLKFGIEHNMYRELGFKKPREFLLYRIIVNHIRNITENAMNIINNLSTFQNLIDTQTLFIKKAIDEEIWTQILNFNTLAHQLFEDSTKAMFKRDYNYAESLIPKRQTYVKLENDLIKLMSNKKLDPNISAILRLIMDSSRRILDYGQNIAELTLNRTVEELCESLQLSKAIQVKNFY